MERVEAIPRQGGRQAEMLLRHGRRVATFAYLLTGDPVEAQALTTETFARLFGEFHELRSAEDFDIRALRRVVQLERGTALLERIKRIFTRRPGPKDAFLKLPVRKRAVLILRYHEDLSDAEIADLMLVSEGAVRSMLEHALSELTAVSGHPVRGEELGGRFEALVAEAPPENRERALRKGKVLRFEVVLLIAITPLVVFMALQIATRLFPGEAAPPASDFVPRDRELNAALYDRFPPVEPKVSLIRGKFADARWLVDAYRSPGKTLCVEVFSGIDYGTGHCVSSYTDYTRTFVSPDLRRRMTFLYGIVDGDAATVQLKRRGGDPIQADLAPAPKGGNLGDHSFFALAIPGYLLQLESRLEGVRLGYVVARVYVSVRDEQGELIERSKILLAEP